MRPSLTAAKQTKGIQKMKHFFIILMGLMIAPVSWASDDNKPYDYPFVNPYEATVIGTPEIYKAEMPENPRVKQMELTVFKDRKIPEIFWYSPKLRYSLAFQQKKAPMIINIAGTGAAYDSTKMRFMQTAFYNAGFHVLSLSSPTHPNFIITASESMVPGHIEEDSRDLYRVMQLAWDQVKDKVNVSEFYLTGYSLGGAQSAFVARLDETKKKFNFKKVLMINPPVSLFNSVILLDELLEENVPGGIDQIDLFFDQVYQKITGIFSSESRVDLSDPDLLYNLYKKDPPKETTLAAIIGISFRISSSNMLFVSDVMSGGNFIVPSNQKLTVTTSLTDYGIVAFRTSFEDYFNDVFFPYFRAKQPGLNRQALIGQTSLESIAAYLEKTEKISVITNEDDIILKEGEIDFFRNTFAQRALIYSIGGHCGNMEHQKNVEQMIHFFKE
jgi:hypothetical protein